MHRLKNHDLALPEWGPYSKCHAGISHIADRGRGLRFDCAVFPGLFRRGVNVPSALWESQWHPWDCAPRFEYFSFRHTLLEKDRLYAEIAYFPQAASNGVFVRCEFFNQTDGTIPAALHVAASLQGPSDLDPAKGSLRKIRLEDARGATLVNPLDYEDLRFGRSEPGDTLVADGLLRGEIRRQDTLDGSALGGRFGKSPGDRVRYRIRLGEPCSSAMMTIRLQGQGSLKLSGLVAADCRFDQEAPGNISFPVGHLGPGEHLLQLEGSAENFAIFAIVIHPAAVPCEFLAESFLPVPTILEKSAGGPDSGDGPRLVLKYPGVTAHYGLAWEAERCEVREILHDELDTFLRRHAHNHVDRQLIGNRQGHFTNVHVRSLPLPARSRTVVWGLVCTGASAAVEEMLDGFFQGDRDSRLRDRERSHEAARKTAFTFQPNEEGRQFAFSQNRMAATTLSNIVFPVYTQRQYIRHRPPGRWWNSLYTWDSGFIGLGLLEISPTQAWENLDQYLTDPGNPHAAFIHHGSMVPMPIHLYHELWNRTQDAGRLRSFYQSLRHCYLYHAGRAEGSATRTLRSGLVKTWDYFYNSGGWDDYPPQVHVHRHKLERTVAPAINSAQVIRCARTMILAARALGETGDIPGYHADIEALGDALEAHSWTEEDGCYSYVVHDAEGHPSHPLRHESGCNYNLGMDGLYPLVAGVCPPERADRLVAWLFDPKRLWSPIGLTAVDMTAPYYRSDGYWSGTVWFPHQWFFWKTMLDLGLPHLAFRIASRALEVWRAEVEETYHCFEHFHIETGRGSGWHQFSGLSTPVMIFYASCYCPGKLTVGFDAWVGRASFSKDCRTFAGVISFAESQPNSRNGRGILVCMQAGPCYRASWNGADVSVQELAPGLLGLVLPESGCPGGEGTLHIHAA